MIDYFVFCSKLKESDNKLRKYRKQWVNGYVTDVNLE